MAVSDLFAANVRPINGTTSAPTWVRSKSCEMNKSNIIVTAGVMLERIWSIGLSNLHRPTWPESNEPLAAEPAVGASSDCLLAAGHSMPFVAGPITLA